MRMFRLAAFAALSALLFQVSARADLDIGFGGNTQPQISTSAGTTQGFINFAVFNTTGGTVGDHFGTGLAGIDTALAAAGFNTSSNFLYLFQDVNVGTDIASSSVNVNGAQVTGHGILSGIAYAQVTSANPFLGGSAAAPGNISGAVTDATQGDATATTLSGLVTPSLLTLNSTSLVASFSPAFSGLNTRTSLWGYTSNFAPAFTLGSIQDSGVAANGTVPGNLNAVPEPSTLLVSMVGGLGFIGYGLRRRFKSRIAA